MTDNADNPSLADFLARHVRPYDPATDDYERPPFAADIKEGKNDSIYNAHSYHTKVPPRSIIPYILHYTQPGDVVLDVFCGSGMTGVAAQMCANPPSDILEQFSELKDRVGPRACILNDLSPAACHIAYNYNTPVDVETLKNEFERIKVAVKDEFDWLYGTEHYEPAVGLYDPANLDVASRLKNPSAKQDSTALLGDEKRDWSLLTKAQVEERLGYPVTDLTRDERWGKLDIATVKQWVCIPATIQYTVWSEVYRCEGFVTIEEPTSKVSTRGKNAGKPILSKKRVARGCGKLIGLWEATDEIDDGFVCPHCKQHWTTDQATWLKIEPIFIIFAFTGIVLRPNRQVRLSTIVSRRPIGERDREKLIEIEGTAIPYWFPKTKLVAGEEGNRLINCGISTVDAIYTKRNLRALAAVWNEIIHAAPRLRAALQFLFTSVSVGLCSKLTRYNFGKRGNGAMAARLFLPHFQCESNVMKVIEGKYEDLIKYFANVSSSSSCSVLTRPAQCLDPLPDASIDFIFTDPPFGRNIAYSELNILWEAWLGVSTDVEKEAITSNARKWNNETYNKKMESAFVEMFRVLKPGRYAMIEFNNRDPELFEAIKAAAIDAGFIIRNMLLLDKDQKTFKQVQGVLRGEGTLDKDVIFNVEKPSSCTIHYSLAELDLEKQVADAVRQHLQTLPERIRTDAAKYNDDHRTAATINSMLMNALIPKGVSVERLNLPFIERICARYFRKVGNRWYLRGEAVGGDTGNGFIAEEVAVRDEVSAIDWLRQQLQVRPMLVGELKPYWQRATGLLPAEVSQRLVLDELLTDNFWRDLDSNRWREPTPEERERMNDDRSLRVLHDAERYLAGSLTRPTTDDERCRWVEVLFKACRAVEDNEMDALPALRGFDAEEAYRVITRLFQSVLKEHVAADVFRRAEKQYRAASSKIASQVEEEKAEAAKAKTKGDSQMTMDLGV